VAAALSPLRGYGWQVQNVEKAAPEAAFRFCELPRPAVLVPRIDAVAAQR
jgi:hypothetical protein